MSDLLPEEREAINAWVDQIHELFHYKIEDSLAIIEKYRLNEIGGHKGAIRERCAAILILGQGVRLTVLFEYEAVRLIGALDLWRASESLLAKEEAYIAHGGLDRLADETRKECSRRIETGAPKYERARRNCELLLFAFSELCECPLDFMAEFTPCVNKLYAYPQDREARLKFDFIMETVRRWTPERKPSARLGPHAEKIRAAYGDRPDPEPKQDAIRIALKMSPNSVTKGIRELREQGLWAGKP